MPLPPCSPLASRPVTTRHDTTRTHHERCHRDAPFLSVSLADAHLAQLRLDRYGKEHLELRIAPPLVASTAALEAVLRAAAPQAGWSVGRPLAIPGRPPPSPSYFDLLSVSGAPPGAPAGNTATGGQIILDVSSSSTAQDAHMGIIIDRVLLPDVSRAEAVLVVLRQQVALNRLVLGAVGRPAPESAEQPKQDLDAELDALLDSTASGTAPHATRVAASLLPDKLALSIAFQALHPASVLVRLELEPQTSGKWAVRGQTTKAGTSEDVPEALCVAAAQALDSGAGLEQVVSLAVQRLSQ